MNFETLEERIQELEELAFANQDITKDESDESDGEFSLLEIFRVVDWEIAEQVNTEGAPPQVRTRETPSSGTTPFPDNRGYCKYAGVVWLQDEVGNKLSWNYIETNAVKEGLPRYPEGRASSRGYRETRNAIEGRMGWAGRWFGGRCRYVGCWARFVNNDGRGWIAHFKFGN